MGVHKDTYIHMCTYQNTYIYEQKEKHVHMDCCIVGLAGSLACLRQSWIQDLTLLEHAIIFIVSAGMCALHIQLQS